MPCHFRDQQCACLTTLTYYILLFKQITEFTIVPCVICPVDAHRALTCCLCTIMQERIEKMMQDLRGRVMDLLDDPSLEAVKVNELRAFCCTATNSMRASRCNNHFYLCVYCFHSYVN